MNPSAVEDIVIRLDSIDQLFNAPDVNPFSDKEVNVIGEAGLLNAVQKLIAKRSLRWENVRFVIQLPPDQVTGSLEGELAKAVHRYCQAKIEDNALMIRLSRMRSLIGLGMVTVISIVLLGLGFLLLNTVLANAADAVQGLVAAAIGVFIWVILWDPMEALLFQWVQPALENRVLRKVSEVEFKVEPQS